MSEEFPDLPPLEDMPIEYQHAVRHSAERLANRIDAEIIGRYVYLGELSRYYQERIKRNGYNDACSRITESLMIMCELIDIAMIEKGISKDEVLRAIWRAG